MTEQYIFEGKVLTKREYENEIRYCVIKFINEYPFLIAVNTISKLFKKKNEWG